MSGFKGTPGPWTYDAREREISDCDSNVVATTRGGDFIGVMTINNGRLIAAAPDLLEACERARSHLYQAGYEPKENSLNPNEDLLFQLNATISKACAE